MGIEQFQRDLRNGMKLETALIKHNLSLKEAFDVVHKPIVNPARKRTPYKKRRYYNRIEENIIKKGGAYHLRKSINRKTVWGGSYDTLEEARTVREYLNEHGWNIVKVNEACKVHGITRRRR